MALRFLLVSLVAGMGFEMPTAPDVESWARSGREWVVSRLADLSDLRDRADLAIAGDDTLGPVAEAGASPAAIAGIPAASDLAFEVASEGMAADFAVDLALARPEEAPPAAEQVATLAEAEMPAALPSGESVDGLVAESEAPAPSRISRLTTAVRLTREAVNAWAILMQPAEAVATR